MRVGESIGTKSRSCCWAWLAARPRFHLHFTPTSISWLNLVEPWFREMIDEAQRQGVVHFVPDLIASIEKDMGVLNDNPRPFVWTVSA